MTDRECEWPEARGEKAEYKVAPIDDRLMFFCRAHLLSYGEGVQSEE